MNVRVLGCSGGIGAGLRTTSLLLDDDVLIDAGTGILDLELAQLRRLRHVFVTHAHLDHVGGIPLLVDTIFENLSTPLTVYGQPETLHALQTHVFNNVIWPDFTRIPRPENPVLRFEAMVPGEQRSIGRRVLEMVPVRHAVPAVGYRVANGTSAFAFSGDTTTNDGFWDALNRHSSLELLIVESAFPDRERELSRLAYHYCPSLLAEDLAKLRHRPKVRISHLKPGAEHEIMHECREQIPWLEVEPLRGGQVLEL